MSTTAVLLVILLWLLTWSLQKDLGGRVRTSDCLWTVEDGCLHIELAKAEAGATWASACAGHELREDQREEDQKRLLLERFQEEVGAEFLCQEAPPVARSRAGCWAGLACLSGEPTHRSSRHVALVASFVEHKNACCLSACTALLETWDLEV
jgi:hypothetical protein